jgi:hypothetical protein
MEQEQYRDLLKSVGIETFVKYYDIFKANRQQRSNEFIKEAFKKEHEEWTENSINTKASCGQKIFQIGKEEDALFYIVSETSRTDDSIKESAGTILNHVLDIDSEVIDEMPSTSLSGIKIESKGSEEIFNNFTFRLITQNRPNKYICFPIDTIKQLFYKNSGKIFFDEWVNKQIAKIKVITSNKVYELSDISFISILEDGSVLVNTKSGDAVELYTHTADNKKRKMHVKLFRQIVLDHVKPIREILNSNIDKLLILCDITKRIYSTDNSIGNAKELKNVANNLLIKGIINKNDIQGLKKELEFLGTQIELQLMESCENAKKSDK